MSQSGPCSRSARCGAATSGRAESTTPPSRSPSRSSASAASPPARERGSGSSAPPARAAPPLPRDTGHGGGGLGRDGERLLDEHRRSRPEAGECLLRVLAWRRRDQSNCRSCLGQRLLERLPRPQAMARRGFTRIRAGVDGTGDREARVPPKLVVPGTATRAVADEQHGPALVCSRTWNAPAQPGEGDVLQDRHYAQCVGFAASSPLEGGCADSASRSAESPLRVMFVSSHDRGGGSERYLERLLELLGPAWVESVASLEDGALARQLQAEGVPVDVISTSRRHLSVLLAARRLRRALLRRRPDLVHANGLKAALSRRSPPRARASRSSGSSTTSPVTGSPPHWSHAGAVWSWQ